MIHNNDDNNKAKKTANEAHRAKRRKLLKRGALLVPAIMTLHARPAMAGGGVGAQAYGADYNSYLIGNGGSVSVNGSWQTKEEARAHDVQQ